MKSAEEHVARYKHGVTRLDVLTCIRKAGERAHGFHCPVGISGWQEDGWVYVIGDPHHPGFVKIGISNNPHKRLLTLKAGLPGKLVLHLKRKVAPKAFALQVERQLHALFSAESAGREWFRLAPEEVVGPLELLRADARRAARYFERRAARIWDGLEDVG